MRLQPLRRLLRKSPRFYSDFHPIEADALAIDGDALHWRTDDGDLLAVTRREGEDLAVTFPNQGRIVLDPVGAVTIRVAPGGDRDLLADRYRRFALPTFMQALGAEVLHASAAACAGGVVVLCGPSQAGKSTTTFAMARRQGFEVWADDTVVVAPPEGSAPRTIRLPARLRLRPETRAHLGDAPALDPDPTAAPDRPVLGFFVLDRRAEAIDAPSIDRLSRAEALWALLPHAFAFELGSPERNRRMFEAYTDLVEHAPVYTARYASGFDRLDALIDAIARQLSL